MEQVHTFERDYGLGAEGDAAVNVLLSRIFQDDVRTPEVSKQLQEGVALIGTFYASALEPACQDLMSGAIEDFLLLRGFDLLL